MSSEIITAAADAASTPLPLPAPRVPVNIRAATAADLPFVDALQRRHAKAVGFMPRAQLEQKVARGEVLVATGTVTFSAPDAAAGGDAAPRGKGGCPGPVGGSEDDAVDAVAAGRGTATFSAGGGARAGPAGLAGGNGDSPLGYLIAADRYFKHDDVGVVYAVNVVPGAQRRLVGAALLAAQFERSAYGCKLYCCWCAQDLVAANRFWEAMGFVPLAYRAGSEKRSRTHIFWQRRIRRDDVTTPWWYPAKTDAGALRADRLVLPIPPGLHWSDPMPAVPGESSDELKVMSAESKAARSRALAVRKSSTHHSVLSTQHSPPVRPRPQFGPPSARVAAAAESSPPPEAKPAKRTTPPREKQKADPKLVAAARELRDRWLEQVNASPLSLPAGRGKYDVGRVPGGAGFQPARVGEQAGTPAPQPISQPPQRRLLSAA